MRQNNVEQETKRQNFKHQPSGINRGPKRDMKKVNSDILNTKKSPYSLCKFSLIIYLVYILHIRNKMHFKKTFIFNVIMN